MEKILRSGYNTIWKEGFLYDEGDINKWDFKLYHRDRAQQIQGIIREVVQASYEQTSQKFEEKKFLCFE